MYIDRLFEQGHDQNHQDHFSQTRLQIIQAVDHQYLAGGLAAMRLIDVADEQLIQAERENQHHGRQQITIHHFHDVRHRTVVQGFARLIGQAAIGIMQRVLEQLQHIHSGHIKNRKSRQQAADYRRDDHKATIPQRSLKQIL